jgi:hypothetical protein
VAVLLYYNSLFSLLYVIVSTTLVLMKLDMYQYRDPLQVRAVRQSVRSERAHLRSDSSARACHVSRGPTNALTRLLFSRDARAVMHLPA